MSDEKKGTSKQEPEKEKPPAPDPRPPQRKALNSEDSKTKLKNEKKE